MRDAGEPYAERLTAPASWWLMGAGLALAVFWAFVVATPLVVAAAAGIIAAGLVVAGLTTYGAARVAAEPDGFRAGRAFLPYRYVGQVEALDAAATRRLLGVEADARAYLLVRAYCRGAVRVMVADRADPAPYWLISTRHPAALAASLGNRAVQD